MSIQPEFLYKIQPTRLAMLSEGPTQRESEIVTQHFDYLKNLLDQGVMWAELYPYRVALIEENS